MKSWLQWVACRLIHLLFGWIPPRRTRVLLYHGIDRSGSPLSVTPEVFDAQMRWLARRGYHTWTASRFAGARTRGERIPRDVVVITFDDGLGKTLAEAVRTLGEHGFQASVFVVTGCVGDRASWLVRDAVAIEAQLQATYRGTGWKVDRVRADMEGVFADTLADWPALKDATGRGVELLSHGRTHHFMPHVDDRTLVDELSGSLADLRQRGFEASPIIAWPYGAYDDRTIDAAKGAGYTAAFAAEPFPARNGDMYRIGRVPVDPRLGAFAVAFAMGRGYDVWAWLRGRSRRKNAGGGVS